jgi:hypothetical protein
VDCRRSWLAVITAAAGLATFYTVFLVFATGAITI